MQKLIFHIDVNSAFLSWEAAYRIHHLGALLDLREIPSIVGGSTQMRNGIVLAKSIPAKAFNIKTGEAVTDAHRKCPELVSVPPHYQLYEDCSRAFKAILNEYSDSIEEYSIDEVFVDMSSSFKLFGNDPIQVATKIKDRIRDELGFTVNIGISSIKVLAKMASDFKKPDRVHTLFPGEIQSKLWPLDVGELFFVGRATQRKLYNLGIFTIGQLARTEPSILESHLKSHGRVIWNFANGLDLGSVESEAPPNKGYGNSKTIPFDVRDAETAKLVFLSLSEKIVSRLQKDNAKVKCISVSIKYSDFEYISHQKMLSNATDLVTEIHQAAGELFDQIWSNYPIRHLGIHTSHVVYNDPYRQVDLFEDSDRYERQKKLQRAVRSVRSKYGDDSLKRLSLLNSGFGHMSGGISKEKGKVEYKKTVRLGE